MAVLVSLLGCAAPPSQPQTVAEVQSRQNLFPSYPQGGQTYLSYSGPHGFQVNYLSGDGRGWLWYPGNSRTVPEEWKRETVNGIAALCWRHPPGSYNPVTRQTGGAFQCERLSLAQRTIVASLPGDPFNLSSGAVPYPRERCDAPDAFTFDRGRFGC